MAKLSPITLAASQFINGIPANGAKLFTYAAGSSTKQATYTSITGLTAQANPIILDSRGEPASPIWLTEGLSYKFVFAPSTDTDPPSSPIWDIDNVTGINDNSNTIEQWAISGVTPTYVSATQFTLPGDQTADFHVGRRIKATVTAGTVYGYITASVFGAVTTVTVELDSGSLDSGLTEVQLGLLTFDNPSIPKLITSQYSDDSVTNAKLAFDGGALGYRNFLINSDFQFSQEDGTGTTTKTDDIYAMDGWYVLTQTAAITKIRQADQEDGTPFNIRLTQTQAVAQRMGLGQVIESLVAKKQRGSNVVESLRIRASASQSIHYAILEWTSSVDAATSDVVNDWTSASYTAGGFFLGANLIVTAVGSITPSANTWTDVTELTGTLSSSVNNIIVLVWTTATAAQNFTLDIARWQLEKGTTKTAFEDTPPALSLIRCQRYYEKSYDVTTVPGIVTSSGVEATRRIASESATIFNGVFKVEKMGTPTVTWYNPNTGTVNQIYNSTGGANLAVTGTLATVPVSNRKTGAPTHAANGAASDLVVGHWTADCRL